MKKQLILLVIVLTAMAIGGCTHNSTDDQITSSGSSSDMSITAIAQSLASGTLDQATYDQLLRTDEDWRKELRAELLHYLDEEDIMTNEEIYAVVGPPEGWSISAEEVNEAGQQQAEQLKGEGRGLDWSVTVNMPVFYSQLSYPPPNYPLGFNYYGGSYISNYGCNLCCHSMLYALWGVPQMNPPALNNWSLNGRQHYAFSTSGNGDLIRLPEAIQYPGICGPYWAYASLSNINSHLCAGRPVKAKKILPGGVTHFVLIFTYNSVQSQGSNYTVKDPLKTSAYQNQPLSGQISEFRVFYYPN